MNFEVLPGLPAVGPYPDQFAPEGRPTHSEGFVVRFIPELGDSWVGNFQRCLSSFDEVVPHPNEMDLLVIAGGQAYVIDPISRKRKNVFGGAIVGAYKITERRLVILNHQTLRLKQSESPVALGSRHGFPGTDSKRCWSILRKSEVLLRDMMTLGTNLKSILQPDAPWAVQYRRPMIALSDSSVTRRPANKPLGGLPNPRHLEAQFPS